MCRRKHPYYMQAHCSCMCIRRYSKSLGTVTSAVTLDSEEAVVLAQLDTITFCRVPISLSSSDGRPGSVKGRISIAHSQMHRSLDISLEYLIPAGEGRESAQTIASVYSIEVS